MIWRVNDHRNFIGCWMVFSSSHFLPFLPFHFPSRTHSTQSDRQADAWDFDWLIRSLPSCVLFLDRRGWSVTFDVLVHGSAYIWHRILVLNHICFISQTFGSFRMAAAFFLFFFLFLLYLNTEKITNINIWIFSILYFEIADAFFSGKWFMDSNGGGRLVQRKHYVFY